MGDVTVAPTETTAVDAVDEMATTVTVVADVVEMHIANKGITTRALGIADSVEGRGIVDPPASTTHSSLGRQ